MKVKFKLQKFELRDLATAIAVTKKAEVLPNPRQIIEAKELGKKLLLRLDGMNEKPENYEFSLKIDHHYIDLLETLMDFAGNHSDVYYRLFLQSFVNEIQKKINESGHTIEAKRLLAGI